MKHRVSSTFILTVLLALPGTGKLLAATTDQTPSDDQIKVVVDHDLLRKDINNVQVAVSSGTVTLTGRVESVWAKQEAVELAENVMGVKEVINDLTIEKPASDDDLAIRLRGKILNYVFYTIYDDVGLSVKDGVVTLTGLVTSPYKASEIADFVSRERGVQGVNNDIQTLPSSLRDDEIRSSLAAAIYREVPEYATQAESPIHIIVDNGRVTLLGTVRSEVEKRIFGHMARSIPGVISVDNRLEVGF